MKAAFFGIVFYSVVIVAGLYGYIHNIVLIIHSNPDYTGVPAVLVLRFVGIFVAPLGVVMGYL